MQQIKTAFKKKKHMSKSLNKLTSAQIEYVLNSFSHDLINAKFLRINYGCQKI